MRDGSAAAALARAGRYQHVHDNLRVEEVSLDNTPGIRWVVCHNPTKPPGTRPTVTTRSHESPPSSSASPPPAPAPGPRRPSKRPRPGGARPSRPRQYTCVPSARCADHPALGRWLRQRPTGRLVLDKTEIAAEERLDGKYLLSTSDPHLSAEDVALGYKNLLEAERGFRTCIPPSSCARCSTDSSLASAPTSYCAGSRCCSSAWPNAAPA